jgi:hypothetical protein
MTPITVERVANGYFVKLDADPEHRGMVYVCKTLDEVHEFMVAHFCGGEIKQREKK